MCQQSTDCLSGVCQGGYCQAQTTNVASCPGYGQPNDNVTVVNGTQCTLSCKGENYDVNGNPIDGCEVADNPTGNHVQTAAARQPALSTCDHVGYASINGIMPSDQRAHENPVVSGFDFTTGSAPDWYVVAASDTSQFGTCQSELVATLQVQGTPYPTCYHLNVVTPNAAYSGQTNNNGTATITQSSAGNLFPDGDVYFEVSKTCLSNQIDAPAYTIQYHF
jgi:hypothetical protein